MKIDLDNDNVVLVGMTVKQAREDTPEQLSDRLAEPMDEAQAHVFGGEHKEAFLVIRIAG